MNGHKFYHVAICVLIFVASLIPHKLARAQEQNFVEIPLEDFHDKRPIELLGLSSSQTLNIPIPQSWLPGEENWLEIKIGTSPLLDAKRSSLTISLNGLQVSSYNLTKITESKQQIRIPADMFTQGNNVLIFTSTLYLPSDRETNCQNWDDPARWITIGPGGLLHLSFVKRDLSVDLSNVPQVFIEPLESYLPQFDHKSTLVVMPEEGTQDDLTALASISYILGGGAETDYIWNPEIIGITKLNEKIAANRNIIFLGEAPTPLQGLMSDKKNYISLLPSPWGLGNAVMLIGDQNRQDGFSPTTVFSDPTRNLLLHGNVAYLDQYSPLAPPPFPNSFSLEDLGYLDRTARGIGQQNLIYNLYIPYDIDPTLVDLNLDLVHSPDLDIQNSSFTVYLNGFSVAGILPNARSSSGTPITIRLPAQKFRPGLNFIRIRFDLYTAYSSCERSPESVWATILNSTTLEMAFREHSPIPSLKYFPLPFSDYPGVIFVVPDRYDQADLSSVSRLSFMIGTSAYATNYPPAVITASNFLKMESRPRNVILLGLPSQNPVTMSTNDLLPQPFTEDGKSLQMGYGVYLPTSDRDASLGLMQIIPSPWDKGGTVLVLTGNDQNGLKWALNAVLDPSLRDQFAGNLMVVGSANRNQISGKLSDQPSTPPIFQQIADASNIPFIGPILQRRGQAFLMPALIALGTALLLVVGILWIFRALHNRKMSDILDLMEKSDERDEDEP